MSLTARDWIFDIVSRLLYTMTSVYIFNSLCVYESTQRHKDSLWIIATTQALQTDDWMRFVMDLAIHSEAK